MIKPACSTISFPELTLDAAVAASASLGFLGLELRTFADSASPPNGFTPEPALTGPAKTRDLFEDAGIDPVSVATSISYDEPIFPPIVGRIFLDTEAPVRATKRAVELAAAMEAPFVRVFGFEFQPGESRKAGVRRVAERLSLALTTARHTGVRLLIENGGSFSKAEHLRDLIDTIGSPLLASAYSPAVGHRVGDDPAAAVRLLSGTLACLKLRDYRGTLARPLGQGEVPNRPAVTAAQELNLDCWAVVDHDRLWAPDDTRGTPDTAKQELAAASATLFEWIAGERSERERRKFAPASPATITA